MVIASKVFESEPCPMCDTGIFEPKCDGVHEFKLGRHKHKVLGLHYALCNSCGTKGYIPGQIDENRSLHKAYEALRPEFISPSSILELREKYGLTQSKAAAIFGGGEQAFSKYEKGTVSPAEPTAKLMKLALADQNVLRELAKISHVELESTVVSLSRPRNFGVKYVSIEHGRISTGTNCAVAFQSGERLSVESVGIFKSNSNREFETEDNFGFDFDSQEQMWGVLAQPLKQTNRRVLN